MRFSLGIVSALLSFNAFANSTVITKIHDIDPGRHLGEDTLLFLSTGQVAKISQNNLKFMNFFQDAKEDGEWVRIELDDERNVLSVQPAEGPETQLPPKFTMAETRYVPSTLGSLQWAQTYFNSMRGGAKPDSQCYDRAQVWSYDWYKTKKFYSSKIFIFFTRRYIREYKFDWWFHVAPYVHVIENGKITERVMDYKYARGPLKIQNWSNIFMQDDAFCPVVKTYSKYANYPESGSCFVMKTPMYYYQPIDMENEELYGTKKGFWMDWEVKNAYSLAFDVTEI